MDQEEPKHSAPNLLGLSAEASIEIGHMLREAREEKGLEIDGLSTKLKIRPHYIAAIESGQFDVLPSTVHGKGLIRIYAKELCVKLPDLAQLSTSLEGAELRRQDQDYRASPRHELEISIRKRDDASPPVTQSTIHESYSHNNNIHTPDIEDILGLKKQSPTHQETVTSSSIPAEINQLSEATAKAVTPKTSIKEQEIKEQPVRRTILASTQNIDILQNKIRATPVEEKVSPEKNKDAQQWFIVKKLVKDSHFKKIKDIFSLLDEKIITKLRKNTFLTKLILIPTIAVGAFVLIVKYVRYQSSRDIYVENIDELEATDHTVSEATPAIAQQQPTPTATTAQPAVEQETAVAQEATVAQPPVQKVVVQSPPPQPEVKAVAPPIETKFNPLESRVVVKETMPEAPTQSKVDDPTLTVNRVAKILISKDVVLKVVIDGKEVFQGTKTAGEYELKFTKKADIFIDDGSKVSMNYAGWNLGVLGHEGRKRRIVLNAQDL